MPNNDFFLEFGSNAESFSKSLSGELAPGVRQINALTEALLKYDETVGNMRAGNPLGGMFSQLDQAAGKLETIGDQISGQFSKIVNSLGTLSRDLTEALDVVTRSAAASRSAAQRQKQQVNAQGYTPEQQRVIDAQRRNIPQVRDEELSPAKVRQTQSTLAKATADGDAARNAVKRVADINATLARNATDSADALKNLGQVIRTLTVQTRTTTKGMEEGRFQQNNIIIPGGGTGGIGINPAQIQTILAAAGVQEAAQAPVRDAAHQAQRDAAEAKAKATTLERSQFSAPARPGSYLVPGETQPRIVSNRINPGETFEGYFERVVSNSRGLNQVRQDVVTASEQRVGIQGSRDLQRVQQLIGRRGLEELAGDPRFRDLERLPGTVRAETIRASVGSVLAPGKSLTPEQYEQVPQALAEFQRMQEDFAKFSRGDVARRISENPMETFAFAPEARRADVFGTVGDYRKQVARYDEETQGPGAGYRAQAESIVAAGRQARQDIIGAYRDLDPSRSVRPEAGPVIGDTGREARVKDTAAEYDAMVEQAKAEARAAREAAGLPAGGGGGRPPKPPKPPTTGSNSEQPEEEPEQRPSLEQTVANRRQKVDRLRNQYEQAYGAGEDVSGLTSKLANAMRRLEAAENKLAAATEEQATVAESSITGSARRSSGRVRGTPFELTDNIRTFADSLQQGTREIIEATRAALPGLTGSARTNAIERAGTALRNDPAFASLGGNLSLQRQTLGTLLQLPRGGATNTALGQVYARGGGSSALAGLGAVAPVERTTTATNQSSAAMERYRSVLEQTAGASAEMQRAQLALFQAEERVRALTEAETTDVIKLATAQRELIAAQAGVERVTRAEQPRSLGTQVFGQQGFGAGQLRHIGLGLENMVGFSLVFEGFDKLKELVHDGLEAQAAFARLQASLDANGISAGNLRQDFQNISAETATPLEHVIEAASELSGTLKTTADIRFGAEVAAQLANISQGTLTAKDAAVGLRDVVAAYGDTWQQSGLTMQQGIKQTGDDIARLSQLTGVNVKDITEGTTQIAQEARDFGLSQRQASTIAAYVAQGTGQSGEQSASQTSRLLSSLYNTRTQETLQRVLKPTNSAGLSIAQQFQSGDIGGVLQELIGQYGHLNDASKQAIAGLMGTGIQARAFAALIGGGANAVKALNGELDSNNALSNQNQRYLQTISGRIKQLDEDFQNLGSELQRIGAFDALGALAMTLDDILKIINKVSGALSNFADHDYFGIPTREALHLAIALGEVAAVWKFVGAGAGSRLVLGSGVGRRLFGNITPRNADEIAAAQAAGSENVPAARYRFRDIARGAGTSRFGLRRPVGVVEDQAAATNTVRSAEERQIVSTTETLGVMDTAARTAAETLNVLSGAARTAAASEEEVVVANRVATTGGAIGAAEQGALFPISRAGAYQPTLFGGGAVGAGTQAAEREAAQVAAQTEGQMLLPLAFRNPTTGRFATPGQVASADAQRIASAEGALPGMTRAELQAMNAGRSGGLLPFPAGAAEEEALATGAGAGFGAQLGKFGKLGAAAPLLAIFGAPVLGQAISGGQSAGSGARGFAGSLAESITMGAGIGGLVGGPLGAALGAIGGTAFGGVSAVLDARKFNNAQTSVASNNAYYKLFDQVVGGFAKGSAGDKASRGQGFKDQLPKLGSAEAVEAFQTKVRKQIESERDKIQTAGGNSKEAQAKISADIDRLETTLQTAAQHRIAAIKGFNKIDVLNSQQIDDLQSALGTVGQLNPETLTTQREAIQNLLKAGTLSPGSKAYKDVLAAAGIDQGQAGQVGRTTDGKYGYYDAGGNFHSMLRQATQTGPAVAGSTRDNNTQSSGIQSTLPGQAPAGAPTIYNPKGERSPGALSQQRLLKALRDGYNESIKQANTILESIGKPDQKSQAAFDKAQAQLKAGLEGLQGVNQQIYQNPIQEFTNRAGLRASLSGTGGDVGGVHFGAGTGGAVADLRRANTAIEKYNKTLTHDDPQYWANIAQIEQNKQQIAQLQNQAAYNANNLIIASSNDALTKANATLANAQLKLKQDLASGASADQIGQDKAAVGAGNLGVAQANQQVTQARYGIAVAQNRNAIAKGQAQLNQVLQAEASARGGTLADQATLLQAQQQEIAIRQQIADAIEAQKESALAARAAVARFHGDDVRAATLDLSKAEDAYRYAVEQYGKNSKEARDAYTSVITSKSAQYDAVTQQIEAGLDLQIQQLNARGVGQGSDLGQAAAGVSLQKAQVDLNRYLKKGGKKGTSEYDKLYGAVIAAQRNQFDVALQAQLDTLDFQKETYQITGAQEIAALQQILKNKQLTLAEQRSITLKIKSLQSGIREQLTQGGLNIPSDIKLPTAYDVRRSLGAGFGGTGTQANIVNNNQQASITVNQTLPTSAMAKAVAAQVISLINQQTGQQVRANSASPRNVPVGRR